MFAASLALALCLGLTAADPARDTVEAEVAKILATLPGDTAFAFTELGDDEAVTLFGVRADERVAVGSTFKLFIFATLVDEVNHGRRQAANVMLLRPEQIGPPSSELADWPIGSPVTLHTLTLKMISISDNTATDHLLYLLGRRRIERQMATVGHGDPAINRPLLSTREMTALRDKKSGMPGLEYQKLDEAAKRKFLAKLSDGRPNYDALDFDTGAYKVSEWYASPLDMARTLRWIRAHTEPGLPAHELRAILAVDPKMPHDSAIWPYVGFKGGSEDQLLAGNWLLQHKNGKWYTMHVYYNNPNGPADPGKTVEAMTKIFQLLESTIH
jgi:beta-lactamase class A